MTFHDILAEMKVWNMGHTACLCSNHTKILCHMRMMMMMMMNRQRKAAER
jgi:hypothetical protein